MTIFKYNNKIYEVPNLEKKLKRMKISLEDIEILEDTPKNKKNNEDDYEPVKLYRFRNPTTGYSITSIYDECPEGYVKLLS